MALFNRLHITIFFFGFNFYYMGLRLKWKWLKDGVTSEPKWQSWPKKLRTKAKLAQISCQKELALFMWEKLEGGIWRGLCWFWWIWTEGGRTWWAPRARIFHNWMMTVQFKRRRRDSELERKGMADRDEMSAFINNITHNKEYLVSPICAFTDWREWLGEVYLEGRRHNKVRATNWMNLIEGIAAYER